jgi:outer membrane protein assembly factor BamA
VVAGPTHTDEAKRAPSPGPGAFLPEPHVLTKLISRVERRREDGDGRRPAGFYPEFGHMVTGAGWISVGPGYRAYLFDRRAMAEVSGAVSWRGYKSAQGTLEFPGIGDRRVDLGVKAFWQDFTQNRFYGVGQDTVERDASDYRVHAVDVVGYGTWRASKKISVLGSVGMMNRPGISSSTGPFDRDEPDTTQSFPDAPAAGLTEQPRYVHVGATLLSDTRDAPGHPSRGRLYRASWATHQDVTGGAYTFNRYDLETVRFLPVAGGRGVLVLHWWGSFTDTSGSHEVPFYLMPALGGNNTLRGYADYRFHDRHMMVGNVESRWALMPHVDAALFFDAGNVGARVKDLDFDRTSWGFGFRVHSLRSTLARIDVGKSQEGWRFLFKLNDALRLGRLSRRMEVVPFAP